jgi:hypothetical protein
MPLYAVPHRADSTRSTVSLWRRPGALISAGALVLSLGGGLVTWQRDHERDQDARVARLEEGRAVADQARADQQDAVLARLDDLRDAMGALGGSLHRENDAILRRLEALERAH